tara:strand:- start:1899 stop:2576 length:678 start_codon:yes stop_codon:yes gene_type:complete
LSLVQVKNLAYAYHKGNKIFEGVSFDVKAGQFWGILGRNGAGKTSLIDLILGLKTPVHGHISVCDEDPRIRDATKPNEIVVLSQDISLKSVISIQDFLEFNAIFYPRYSKQIEKELLTYFNVDPSALIGALSTGQQKKVQVVAGLAADTKVIIIDEITAVLDPETRFLFFKKLQEFNRERGKTILLATNISEDLQGRVTNILYINDGKAEEIDPATINQLFNVIV